jgi:hypothetical protein
MTLEQKEKGLKIAAACGWTCLHVDRNIFATVTGQAPEGYSRTNTWVNTEAIPDYFNDLNAMHEAEKTICGENFDTPLWINYLCNLDRVVDKRRAHATASQRAEAFGKTLNLW